MEQNNKILLNKKEKRILNFEGIELEMVYSDKNKSLEECLLNILKQKEE